MEETLEYWQEKLAEFEEALQEEQAMDVVNESMVKLLKKEIEYCNQYIQELS
jgi:cob(I)alamin adenosyltransferase